jgi:hypothetical protein
MKPIDIKSARAAAVAAALLAVTAWPALAQDTPHPLP